MKYDDASWHSGGNFPDDLPPEAGATHSGMFLAWALLSGLGGSLHIEDFPDSIPQLQSRAVTPGAFLLEACDGKLTNEDFSDEGNAFTQFYFDFEKGKYLEDYETAFPDRPSLYHVEDSWASFDIIKPILDKRLSEWRRAAQQPHGARRDT
jgi:hypothetical protein